MRLLKKLVLTLVIIVIWAFFMFPFEDIWDALKGPFESDVDFYFLGLVTLLAISAIGTLWKWKWKRKRKR